MQNTPHVFAVTIERTQVVTEYIVALSEEDAIDCTRKRRDVRDPEFAEHEVSTEQWTTITATGRAATRLERLPRGSADVVPWVTRAAIIWGERRPTKDTPMNEMRAVMTTGEFPLSVFFYKLRTFKSWQRRKAT